MKSTLISFLLISSFFVSNAQDFFLVELENRSPSVQDLVKSYEGYPVIPFMANDMNGNEQNLAALSGDKHTILYFWHLDCGECIEQISDLNLLKQNFGHRVDIISLAHEDRRALWEFTQKNPVDFPIVPNSKTLADGPYGGDLGYPRLFVIDDYGLIRWVFTEETFKSGMDTYKVMETLITQLDK